MPRRKKKIIQLQEYNKRRRISFDETKETEINEKNTVFIERENEEIEEKKEMRTCPLAELRWNKSEKNKRTIKGIPKITYYHKFGTSSVLANASKGTPKITSFWGNGGSVSSSFVLSKFSVSSNRCVSEFAGSSVLFPSPFPLSPSLSPSPSSFSSPPSPSPSSFLSPSPSPFPTLPGSLSKKDESLMLCERIAQLRNDLLNNRKMLTVFEYNRQRAVYEYLTRLNNGYGKMKASEEATRIVYIISKPYTAKWIRSLAKFYLNHKSFSVSYHGKHQKYE